MVKISVAIPTFMRAANLARTLKSFYIQDFPKKDYELIVVDDGGSDNTKEVCDEAAKHCNVQYFYRKSVAVPQAWTEGSSQHQGTANRRWNIVFSYNIALRRAQGDIFMVTTADNIQISPTLSQMLKWHDDHKGDPVCVGGKLEYHLKEGVWPKQEDWGNLPA
jgi:glycosyltransferase involved in cell wall biosynthesis